MTGTDCENNSGSIVCCVPKSSGTGGGAKTALSDCTSTCSDSDGCTCPTTISCNAGSGASIANGANCGGNAASGSGSCSSGDCFTGIANCGSVGRQINSGSCSVNGTAGICCAFDGQQGGGSTPTPSKAQCGSSCNSTADCAGSSAGYAVTCRNGTCQNASCAEGKTVAGANCECSSLNACGQPCSASLGLCQTGSSCGFIGATSSCLSNSDKNNGTQYCLPNSPYKNYTLTTCSSIAASNLRAPGGANVTSQAQVIEACTAPVSTITAVCGDGVCSGTESSVSCPNDCRLPDTAIFSDRIDRIILGIVVILLGISLTGGFDKFRKYKK